MTDDILERIATSLERIAELMENKERREINERLNQKRKQQEKNSLRSNK